MFNSPFQAKVKKVEVFAMELDEQVFRRIRMTFEREYDDEMADAMGTAGKEALEHVSNGGFSSVVLPIDAIKAELDLKSASAKVTIKQAVGIKATVTAPKPGKKSEDAETLDGPTLQFSLVAPWLEETWTFLGRHALDHVEVVMKKAQFELPLAHPPKAPRGPAGNGNGSSNDPEAAADLGASLKGAGQNASSPGKKGRGKSRADAALERAIDAVAETQGATPAEPLTF